MRRTLLLAACALAVATPASAVFVSFSEVVLPTTTVLDGTTHYAPYGISFEDETIYAVDAVFSEDGLGIASAISPARQVTVVFDQLATSVNFSWVTIGGNDIFANAFDAGGNLVDTFSATGLSGTSTGTGSVTGGLIKKVTWSDGVGSIGIDSMRYTPIPEPTTLGILALGLLGFARRRFAGSR